MNKQKFMEKLSAMPPLRHSVQPEGEPFVLENSAALKWVMALPGFQQWVWNRAVASGRIVYSPETKCWSGKVIEPRADGKDEEAPVGRPPIYTEEEVLALMARVAARKEDGKDIRSLKDLGFAGSVSTLYTMIVKLRERGVVNYEEGFGFWLAPAKAPQVEEV